MGKTSNTRRFPGERSSKRPDKAADRRGAADVRQEDHDKLSTAQKLAKLDAKFGVGVGAAKERAKLQRAPALKQVVESPTIAPEVMEEIEAMNEVKSKKRSKAKDRRKESV